MRGQDFLDKMELIEPAYVEAADIMPKKKKSIWIKCGAAAACLCLAIAGFIAIGQQNEPSQTGACGRRNGIRGVFLSRYIGAEE